MNNFQIIDFVKKLILSKGYEFQRMIVNQLDTTIVQFASKNSNLKLEISQPLKKVYLNTNLRIKLVLQKDTGLTLYEKEFEIEPIENIVNFLNKQLNGLPEALKANKQEEVIMGPYTYLTRNIGRTALNDDLIKFQSGLDIYKQGELLESRSKSRLEFLLKSMNDYIFHDRDSGKSTLIFTNDIVKELEDTSIIAKEENNLELEEKLGFLIKTIQNHKEYNSNKFIDELKEIISN